MDFEDVVDALVGLFAYLVAFVTSIGCAFWLLATGGCFR